MASRGVLRRLGAGGLAGVLLAVAAPMAWGQSTQKKGLIAGNCTWSNKLGSRWNPLRPQLSSAAQVSDVLSERGASVTTDFTYVEYGESTEEYELIVAAFWEPQAAVDRNGWAKTNIPGISMTISANGQVVTPGHFPVVVAKHALAVNDGKFGSKQDSVHTALTQQLVLASPLDQLPSEGPLVVTGVSIGAGFTMYAMTFRKGMYQLGQTIPQFPSYPGSQSVCVSSKFGPLLGSGIMGLGAGGSEVAFSNACEVGLTQTKTVQLGSYSLRDFPSQGATSEERPFNITLGKCSALAKPKISFTAKHGASADKTVLKLDPKADDRGLPPAKGVGIVMINAATNKRIEFGKFYDMARAGADSASMFLRASYLRTAAHPAQMAGGHANGTAEFTIEFP